MANLSKVIFHIGTNKTGSSSLQVFLSEIDHPKINYLKVFRDQKYGNSHHPLALSMKESKNLFLIRDFFNMLAKDKINIVSSERFWEIEATFFEKVKNHLLNLGYETIIVLYLRPPVSYSLSWYQEYVHHRISEKDFSDWLTKNNYNYENLINNLKHTFNENLILRPYVRNLLKNNDIIEDFISLVSLPISKNIDKENNFSINGKSFLLKKYINNLINRSDLASKKNVHDFFLIIINKIAHLRTDIGKIKVNKKDFDLLIAINQDNINFYKKHFNISENLDVFYDHDNYYELSTFQKNIIKICFFNKKELNKKILLRVLRSIFDD